MIKNLIRISLGVFMLLAGIGHLTYARETFQAQVPDWLPLSKDFVVLASGIVEIILGAGMIFFKKHSKYVGLALALFYVLIFPGNISQFLEHRDGFGLDTDMRRFVRLLFQPVLIFLALYSTNALQLFNKNSRI